MKNLISVILALTFVMPAFAEPEKLRTKEFEFEGYKFILTTFENDELDESLWFFTNMEVLKDGVKVDEYKRLPEFSLREKFIINGEPIVYFHKMGGSGGGAGVHRYKLNSKEFDFFEGNYKSDFPSFNEIYKFEDTNNDGNPELFAASRRYSDTGFNYYWTVYEWPLDVKLPIKLREE